MNLQTEFNKSLSLLDGHIASVNFHLEQTKSSYGLDMQTCILKAVNRLKYARNCLHHAESHLAEMKKTGGLK